MPRRFRFPLQKVLELRTWEEKQAQIKLAAKTGECVNLENLIKALMVEKHESFKHRKPTDPISVLWAYEAYGKRLQKQIEDSEKLLAQKMLEREELLKIFLEAQKKRKVMDKLRENQLAVFKMEEMKRDAKNQDDLNTAAYIRKMKDSLIQEA